MPTQLLESLISLPSVTPNDAGCQTLLSEYLSSLGFEITHLPFGQVQNLWARYGNANPLFIFLGHTDVVPTGDESAWQSPPFTPSIRDGYLYGRGAVDMKGSLAAMSVACRRFIQSNSDFKGSIAFLLTSDEEGPAMDGTRRTVEYLKEQGILPTWCLVGEPSCESQLGDTIKIGRRGSLNCRLTIHGKQGHIAYPHLAINPIHSVLPALWELSKVQWDKATENFPATSFQISNIKAGVGVTNVIPGSLEVLFNFRYAPSVSVEELKQKVTDTLNKHALQYDVNWIHSASPFLTPKGKLLKAAQDAIQTVTGISPVLSTDGGTSDGRFMPALGCEVIELGPLNASIHQANEHIELKELDQLTEIYETLLRRLFYESP